jgi:hypothetical protein
MMVLVPVHEPLRQPQKETNPLRQKKNAPPVRKSRMVPGSGTVPTDQAMP